MCVCAHIFNVYGYMILGLGSFILNGILDERFPQKMCDGSKRMDG